MLQDTQQGSLELLYSISQELTTTLDLPTILSRVLFLSTQNLGADRGSLIVLDEQLKPLEAVLAYDTLISELTIKQIQDIIDNGLAGWVIQNRQPALIPDTLKDQRWLLHPDDAAEASGSKSAICVPLIPRDRLVGILTIVHPVQGFFNQEHLHLLQSIAGQAGIAIYNSLLYENLQVTHRYYRELFEESIDPIIITDSTGIILSVNRQVSAITQLNQDQLLEASIFELHENHLEKQKITLENFPDGNTISYESEIRNTKGSVIPIEVHIQKLTFWGDGNLQWLIRDISERKALEKLRHDLSAMIYHDIRSPLSNIITSLDILDSIIPADGDPTLRTILSVINRSADRVQRLVSSLLDIDRLEAGQAITIKSDVNINHLVQDALEAVEPIFENKQLTSSTQVSSDIPMLWADEDMIKRVLINLVENSAKYTQSKGQITVGAKIIGSSVNIWVEDNGPGIPPAANTTLFDKFSRLNIPNAPKGFGLGLAFCRLAIEAHGGAIWIESPGETGSRFIFSIPLKNQ